MGKRSRESCGRGGGCPRGGWGPRGGVHWGPDRQHVYHTSFSSEDTSSDSETDITHKFPKKIRKHFKKHIKHWHKHGHRFGHHWPPQWAQPGGPMGPPDGQKTMCTLCWHRIKPLAETEILECGHIYHRLCLKELFELAMKSSTDPLEVFCSHCKEKIEDNLMNELRLRFAGFGTTDTTDDATAAGHASTSSRPSRRESRGGQLMVVDIDN
ncbi:unnamed protein product [Medioppia subpectinata]|uniref:RING-type domain-containing protein n=1 Tax=Medioppia subpectinata TaxID=1979941 RepID=A0A7R9KYU4_9ACAR|nr:unnamed protein product [Medioppia subpectinata]CAG2112416.1 unnamed protein product [Medioppia subpectinata]